MADRPSVSIQIGGATYKVQSSASPEEVQRLADLVDEKLRALNPGNQPVSPQSFLLVALAFAHDLEEERRLRKSAESDARDLLRGLDRPRQEGEKPRARR